MASTAFYLASSLTAMGHPSGADRPIVAAPVMAAAPAVERAIGASSNAFPVTIVFPAPVRTGGAKSLGDLIADEVRRDSVEHPAGGSAMAAAPGGDDDADDGGSVNEAVVAAHDARIALLKQRIEEARTDGGAAAGRVNGLRVRLHLAEAARRLAVVRDGGVLFPAACMDGGTADACRPATVAAVAMAATGGAMPSRALVGRRAAHRASSERPHLPTDVASARPAPAGARGAGGSVRHSSGTMHLAAIDAVSRRPATAPSAQAITAQAVTVHAVTVHAVTAHAVTALRERADRMVARHAPAARSAADASEHARRLLAAARRLLEEGAGPGDAHARIELAGLWHWKGSDTWSLTDCPKDVA